MRYCLIILFLLSFIHAMAQHNPIMEEARLLERQFKNTEAINKYQQLLQTDPNNKIVLLRITELFCMQGNEMTDEAQQKKAYESAAAFARQLWIVDSTSADAHYAKALVMGRIILFSPVKEKAKLTKGIKEAADKALSIEPQHVKALYTLAKWNDEVASLNPAAKAALKMFFGGLPMASSDEALLLYKKVRELSPAFIANNLDYALALKKAGRSDLAIEVLKSQLKYPIKTSEDRIGKEQSKKLLDSLQ